MPRKFCGRPGCYASYYCGCDQPPEPERSKKVLLPQDIMLKVSQHYADHIEAVQIAAEAGDDEKVEQLKKRHNNFKLNVNKLLDVEMIFAANTQAFEAPKDANLFSVTINSVAEPIFADYIGKHTKLLVARWDDVYTCLYSLDEWEEEYDPLS